MNALPAVWQHAIGWALIHSLWQGAVAALVLALALRLIRTSSVRYAAACLALCAAVAAPVATCVWLASDASAPRPGVNEVASELRPAGWSAVAVEVGGAAVSGASDPAGGVPIVRRASAAVEPAMPWIVRAWAAGVLLLSLRLLGGWLWVQRLARSALLPAPPEWIEALEAIRGRLGIRRRVRLFLSPRVSGPALVGWLRPVVLMPLSASSGLTPCQVELLLLHELVHVRRWDYLVNLVQRLAETVLFYHPGVWWVSARIREEREHCCDDAVVARSGVRDYVMALLALEDARAPQPALAMGAGGASLVGRVRRLVDPRASESLGATGPTPAGVAGLALLGIAVALAGAPGAGAREPAPAFRGCADATGESTLCPGLSRTVDALLRGTDVPGAAIVQDVATGAVLAYAQAGDSVDVREPVLPASLWKLAVAAVWWERGLGSAEVDCPSSVRVGGSTVRNGGAGGLGRIRAPEEVLVHSCNTGAVEMVLRLGRDGGAERLAGELRGLGFPVARAGEPRGADSAFWSSASPAFRARMAPASATIQVHDDAPGAMARLALATSSVRVTPLHLSRFLQAVGNGGVMRAPTVEAGRAAAGGGVRVMSGATASHLQQAMLRTVREGTARAAAGSQPGAWKLGGKTGTVTGTHGGPDGWFAGLVVDPQGRPRYTVLIHLRGGGPGGDRPTKIAAQIARSLADAAGRGGA